MEQFISLENNVWPAHFRVTSLIRLPSATGRGVHNEATLYHDALAVRVVWQSASVDSRLKYGSLVSVRGVPLKQQQRSCCPVPIGRLELLDKPIAALNLFETIPLAWVKDRSVVERAIGLWEKLSRPFQHLLNAVIWDGGRLQRFVTGPATLSDHPSLPGENFRCAVASAVQGAMLVKTMPDVSSSVIITAALLSHIGKADDYRLADDHYELSQRGYWVGGQYTTLEWLAVARAKVIVPDDQYLALVHALIGAKGMPADRQSMEATVLAVATRLADSHAKPGLMVGHMV